MSPASLQQEKNKLNENVKIIQNKQIIPSHDWHQTENLIVVSIYTKRKGKNC